MTKNKSSLAKKVLNKIKKGQVKMWPKFYFTSKAFLFILGIVFILFLALFLVSFIIFNLRATGALFLPRFGLFGLRSFFMFFPWLLVIFPILFIIALIFLAKRYRFVYKKPLLYSIIAIVVIVLVGSFIFLRVPIHKKLSERAWEGGIPMAGPLYRQYGMRRPENLYIGRVIEITENGFQMETVDGQGLTINISDNVRFPIDKDIKKDDFVVVMGKKSDAVIDAYGVHKIKEDNRGYMLPRGRPQGVPRQPFPF